MYSQHLFVQVEMDAGDKGALRLARDACPDVLLCEELKHLYTALTRAKNNVVIFDSNTAKRAPFFHYLRRLGMAQYVSRLVLQPLHLHLYSAIVLMRYIRNFCHVHVTDAACTVRP